MTLELEDYQLLFDEYLDTGVFPEGLEEDCLAEYLKQMLDDEETRFKCTSDPIWRDLVKASLVEFFEQLLVLFLQVVKEEKNEKKQMDDFLQADIAQKRIMWPMIEQDIRDYYPQSEVNLDGYIQLMWENEIGKDDIFKALVDEWRKASEERSKQKKQKLLDTHKNQHRQKSFQVGMQDYETIKETEKLVFKYPQLKEIIRMMGREKESPPVEKDSTVTRNIPLLLAHSKSKEEVDGIRTGDDLNALLPTEVVWLSDPRTELLFLHKLASKQLQLFSSKPPAIKRQKTQMKENKESRLEEGPMIICVDTSGSMEGKAEHIAKSLTMQILQAAKRKMRKCMLVTFSVRSKLLEITQPKHWKEVRNFMNRMFTGGTDGEDMLRDVLKALDTEHWSMADVLLISDFDFFLPTMETLKKIADEQQKGTRFYGLQIGHDHTGYEKILDRIWRI